MTLANTKGKDNSLILASKSPRRQELMKNMGFDFQIIVREVEESFPNELSAAEAVQYIARKKAEAFLDISPQKVVLTADTIVVLDGDVLGKPADEGEAVRMLKRLSGRWHEVMTACCLLKNSDFSIIFEVTRVLFDSLSQEDIEHYVAQYKPLDKAGGYGIQEWIGTVGITRIEGSYHNVVGLPTAKLYKKLKGMGLGE